MYRCERQTPAWHWQLLPQARSGTKVQLALPSHAEQSNVREHRRRDANEHEPRRGVGCGHLHSAVRELDSIGAQIHGGTNRRGDEDTEGEVEQGALTHD